MKQQLSTIVCRFDADTATEIRREAERRGAPISAVARDRFDAGDRIAEIIEAVDVRCMAADGPVTPTPREITQDELSRIYALAKGKPERWRP